MSTISYSQDKWSSIGDVVYIGNAGGFSLRYCPQPEANAERIAACVNFCRGIGTKNLQDNYTLTRLLEQRDDERSKTTKLKEALVKYEKVFDELFGHCCSNGVFNQWGKMFDCTELNEAHQTADRVLKTLGE
ncbi:hypothetical protein D3C77_28800 [compost metagenome]